MYWIFYNVDFRVIVLLICTQLEDVRRFFQNPTSYGKWILFQAFGIVIDNRMVFHPAIRVSRIPDLSPSPHFFFFFPSSSLCNLPVIHSSARAVSSVPNCSDVFKSLTRWPNQHLFLLCPCGVMVFFF